MIFRVLQDNGNSIGQLTVPDSSTPPAVGDYIYITLGGPLYKVVNRLWTVTAGVITVVLQVTQFSTSTATMGL